MGWDSPPAMKGVCGVGVSCVLSSPWGQWRSGQYCWWSPEGNSSLSEADSYLVQVNCSLAHTAWINQPCMGDKQTVDWEQRPPVPTETPWWMGIKERCCHYCCHTASGAGIHGSKGCWNMNCTQVRARKKRLKHQSKCVHSRERLEKANLFSFS